MQLGAPHYLWMLWLVVGLVAFYAWSFARRQKLLLKFSSAGLLPRLVRGVSEARRKTKAVLVCVAALLLVLALAEPKIGFTWEDVQRRGVDIVVALDVSDSMLVQDNAGDETTRLVRAKREIADLLSMLDGDRIGLVGFSGAAFVECPLTLDYGAATQFLEEFDPDLIAEKGTAMGAAIRTSMQALEKSPAQSRAILLITDGEDTTGDAIAAAEKAKEAGIKIFTIGIGRDEGAPIPDGSGGFRRDEQGEIVLSKLDESTLQQMALMTGGTYVRSVTGDVDLTAVYKNGIKRTLTTQELGSSRRQNWHGRYQWLVALAMILLVIEALLPERARRGTEGAR